MNYLNYIPEERMIAASHSRMQIGQPLQEEDNAQHFAQVIEYAKEDNDLKTTPASYALIGVEEDIGIRANFGRPGASEAWGDFLSAFLALQHTSLNRSNRFILAGTLEVSDLMTQCAGLDPHQDDEREALSKAVGEIDERLSKVIYQLKSYNLIPIVIGGGHNNAYPLLKVTGYQQGVNCVNIDAHTDLRVAIGRHSGNGFRHALEDGYLNEYHMIGLHKSSLSSEMLHRCNMYQQATYTLYAPEKEATDYLSPRLTEVCSMPYGLEIDMDVVADFPSSAQSPMGLSFAQLCVLVQEIKQIKQPEYIHICEAAPCYGYPKQVGKALAQLVNLF